MAELSEEQVAELRQAFDMFDRDKGGSISTKELGYTMRAMGTYCSRVILSLCRLLSLGMNPTEAEILDLLCEVRGGGIPHDDNNIFIFSSIQTTTGPSSSTSSAT